jgi:hypothetical protein
MAQDQIFRGTGRSINRTEDGMRYHYHSTAIVETDDRDHSITLRSGGYRTRTTKLAMNQVSNQFGLGFKVFQKDFDWFVEWKGKTLPFEDGMLLR